MADFYKRLGNIMLRRPDAAQIVKCFVKAEEAKLKLKASL